MSKSKRDVSNSGSKLCVLHFRVEPHVKSWVERTIKDPKIPFHDKSDFLYWALLEALKRLKNEHPGSDIVADYALHEALVTVDKSIERENTCVRVLEATRHRARHLIAKQAYDELEILLRKMKISIDSMPSTPDTIKTKKQWNLEFGRYVGTVETPVETAEKPNGKIHYDPSRSVSLNPDDAEIE